MGVEESGRAGWSPDGRGGARTGGEEPGRAGGSPAGHGGAKTGDEEPGRKSRPGGLRRWLAARGRGRLRAPRESTRIARAIEFFLSVHKRKCVVFVVSDFIDDAYEQALRTANRKHDVVAVLVTDRRELEIDDVGLIALEDPETGARRVVDAGSPAFRAAVSRDGAARVEALRARLGSSGIDLIHVDAAGSVVDPLVRFFRAREKRVRR